jgi:hypothetical protein
MEHVIGDLYRSRIDIDDLTSSEWTASREPPTAIRTLFRANVYSVGGLLASAGKMLSPPLALLASAQQGARLNSFGGRVWAAKTKLFLQFGNALL